MADWSHRTVNLQSWSHSGLRAFAIAALLPVLLWFSAGEAAAPQSSAVAAELQSDVRRLGETGGIYVQGLAIASASLLTEFYASRNYLPVWTSEARIDELFGLLATADSHGLDPGDYYLPQLRSLREQYRSGDDPALGAALDLLLTESLIRFGYHQRFGKVNPARMEPTWNFTRQLRLGRAPLSALQEVVAAPSLQKLLGQWIDRAPLYRALQEALAHYRNIALAGGWPVIASGPTLREGDTDARIPALRGHLVIGGDLPPTADTADEYFDAALADGIRAFQNRHALATDGVVGPATLAAMNIPVEGRIDQLRLSLERARWVADDTAGDVIVANIAGSEVFAARNGQRFWTRRAVVGRVTRQTPVFRGSMTWLELNPTWTVPPTILREDILPRLRRDPGYLQEQRISVIDARGRVIDPLTVDWERVGNRPPYTFRQAPGAKNSLGRIKFMFPNPHAVFLHDTPARGQFERTGRLLSSGCVRIEDPLSLAEILLADPGRWNRQTLQAAIDTGKTQTVTLPQPWPILILYWTAELDAAGRVRFLPDVYDRDPALLAALNGEVLLEFPFASD
jgi:murein L,D-transpeptidase YcbB/YkuD